MTTKKKTPKTVVTDLLGKLVQVDPDLEHAYAGRRGVIVAVDVEGT